MAEKDSYLFSLSQRRDLPVLLNDFAIGASAIDPSTLSIITPPQHAVPQSFEVQDGEVHYRARGGFVGPDSFVYEICTFAGDCDTATVFITVSSRVAIPDVCTGFTEASVQFSYDFDRRDSAPLAGQEFIGVNTVVTIFATAPETTDSVSFFIDDPTMTGPPINTEVRCPFDVVQTEDGLPLTTIPVGDFGPGLHTMTILVVDQDGTTTIEHAEFFVDVTGTPVQGSLSGEGVDCQRAIDGDTNLAGADLTNCGLVGVDLTGADLLGADLTMAILINVPLDGAVLDDAVLVGAELLGATFDGASLVNANLAGSNISTASFQQSDMTGAQLNDTFLINTVLTGASIDGAVLDRADLTGADFAGAVGVPSDTNAVFDGTTCSDGTTSNGPSCWP